MNVLLNTDSEGFISRECPTCSKRFKVKYTEEETGKVLSFCPYCGHEGRDCWWTQEQADYITALVSAKLVLPELEKSAQAMERATRGGPIQFKAKVQSVAVPPAPIESDEPWPTKYFACCDEPVKHDATTDRVRCSICGKSENLT